MRELLFPSLKVSLAALLLCVCKAAPVAAREVSPGEACAAAQAYARDNAAFGLRGEAMFERTERTEEDVPLWHWVRFGAEGPWVAMAADTTRHPVLAVLPRSPHVEGAPPALTLLGAEAASGDSDTPRARAAEAAWARLLGASRRARARAAEADAPFDDQTLMVYDRARWEGELNHWNQTSSNAYGSWASGTVYDRYTPRIDGRPTYVGCVATAGCILSQFFRWPENVEPFSNFVWVKDGKGTEEGVSHSRLTLSSREGPYDWASLPNPWRSGQTLTEAQQDLLGRVGYNLGVACNMQYGFDGSGTAGVLLASGLRKWFGWRSAYLVDTANASHLGEAFEVLLYGQLRAGIPVEMNVSGTRGQHAVVACGVARDTLGAWTVRVQMGYGGIGDGWYALPDVGEFSKVEDVTTLLSPTDEDVVALFGRVVDAEGLPIADEPVRYDAWETHTDANGYYAFRVGLDAPGKALTVRGEARTLTWDPSLLRRGEPGKYGPEDPEAFVASLPHAQDFTVPTTPVYAPGVFAQNAEEARDAAIVEGKPILAMYGDTAKCKYSRALKRIVSEDPWFGEHFVLWFGERGDSEADATLPPLRKEGQTGIPWWCALDGARGWRREAILPKTFADGTAAPTEWTGLDAATPAFVRGILEPALSTPRLAVAAVDVAAPAGAIVAPARLNLRLTFADGSEYDVRRGVRWTLVSGADVAELGPEGMLTPAGAGRVTVRAVARVEGRRRVAEATLEVGEGIWLEGPETWVPRALRTADEAARFRLLRSSARGVEVVKDGVVWQTPTLPCGDLVWSVAEGEGSLTIRRGYGYPYPGEVWEIALAAAYQGQTYARTVRCLPGPTAIAWEPSPASTILYPGATVVLDDRFVVEYGDGARERVGYDRVWDFSQAGDRTFHNTLSGINPPCVLAEDRFLCVPKGATCASGAVAFRPTVFATEGSLGRMPNGETVSFAWVGGSVFPDAPEAVEVPVGWCRTHFPQTPEADLPTLLAQDSDGDGHANWQEYVTGTDPNRAEDRFAITAIHPTTGGGATVDYGPRFPGRRYTLLGKASLADGEWRENPGPEARFFRVRVTME